MASAINHVTHPVDPNTATQAQRSEKAANSSQKAARTQSQPAKATPKDTVQISKAAQTALQESQETQAQTTKEAQGGDRQAQVLLAKETAAKKVQK